MKQIFIPNMTYDHKKLQNMKKKTEKFILGLSSIGSFKINTNKIVRIHEKVGESYCIADMFINEVTTSFHSTNFLPLDVVYLKITRETYHYENICLCVETFTENVNKQNERVWIELNDEHADENMAYNIISSFLSIINV